jgi:type I restriction modification DNA specificity domain protein
MKYIEKLLNGAEVKWMPLGEVAELKRGRVISKEYLFENVGDYPVYSSQTVNNGEIGRINTFDFEQKAITWTTDGANAGTVFYREGRFSITNICGLITIKDTQILSYKYLYYWLSIEAKKHVYSGMGNPKLMSNQMGKVPIPIPPLAVQEEIVRILDKFTTLEAELDCRKRQYEYYRNQLLSLDVIKRQQGINNVTWLTLEEVFETRNGYTPSKANAAFWENGTIPWFRMEDIRANGGVLKDSIQHVTPQAIKGKGLFMAGSIIMATTATIGEHALITVDALANQRFTNFRVRNSMEDKLLTKFVYYYFFIIDEWCKQNVNVSSFPSVEIERLKKQPFPIPPLAEQQRIVSILDKFEALTTSISEGLPKEIELRRKQYEYYRNQLLSFA